MSRLRYVFDVDAIAAILAPELLGKGGAVCMACEKPTMRLTNGPFGLWLCLKCHMLNGASVDTILMPYPSDEYPELEFLEKDDGVRYIGEYGRMKAGRSFPWSRCGYLDAPLPFTWKLDWLPSDATLHMIADNASSGKWVTMIRQGDVWVMVHPEMRGEDTERNRIAMNAGAPFCPYCARHHFDYEGNDGCSRNEEPRDPALLFQSQLASEQKQLEYHEAQVSFYRSRCETIKKKIAEAKNSSAPKSLFKKLLAG